FVSQSVTTLSGTPIQNYTFSNAGGVLTFGNLEIPAGQQIVIKITVVLNNTPANVPGKQFINTAKWTFGRLINNVDYENLPGQWRVTPPMTIAAAATPDPTLVMRKSGPATMTLGQQPGTFTLDIQNTGASDAWNTSIRDNLPPQSATGGMCAQPPTIVSA